MVQKNENILIETKEEQNNLRKEKKTRVVLFSGKDQDNSSAEIVKQYHLLRIKSVNELLMIAQNAKNGTKRLVAIKLIGKKGVLSEKVRNVLHQRLTFEHTEIKKECLFALARLGDKTIREKVFEIALSERNLADRIVAVRLLGKIGTPSMIEELLPLSSEENGLLGLNTGAAIQDIIQRFGPKPLLLCLYKINSSIQKQALWLLSAYSYYLASEKNQLEIIENFLDKLASTKDISLSLALAYHLSLHDQIKGALKLINLCRTNPEKVSSERVPFLLEEANRCIWKFAKQAASFWNS
jgi:hypothetical protein